MNGAMTRRAFAGLLGAVGAVAIAAPKHRFKRYSAGRSAGRFSLAVRYFYTTRDDHTVLAFYVRVLDTTNFAANVPVSLRVATDRTFQKVLWQASDVASHDTSHIIRAHATLTSQTVARTLPLHGGVFLGNATRPSSVWRMRA
jgi:phosphodiesterase/alkaline phosphatase D-like protein